MSSPSRELALEAEAATLRAAIAAVIASTRCHLDGRDLLAEMHPRRTIDIKRRVDGVETWFEGDWLSNVWDAVKAAQRVLDATGGSPFSSRDSAMGWARDQNIAELRRTRPDLFAGGVETSQGATGPEVSQSQMVRDVNGTTQTH